MSEECKRCGQTFHVSYPLEPPPSGLCSSCAEDYIQELEEALESEFRFWRNASDQGIFIEYNACLIHEDKIARVLGIDNKQG